MDGNVDDDRNNGRNGNDDEVVVSISIDVSVIAYGHTYGVYVEQNNCTARCVWC